MGKGPFNIIPFTRVLYAIIMSYLWDYLIKKNFCSSIYKYFHSYKLIFPNNVKKKMVNLFKPEDHQSKFVCPLQGDKPAQPS